MSLCDEGGIEMSATIQVRVDEELKAKSDELFRDLGTDTTTAIRIFLTQAVANNGFPFEIKRNDNVENPYKYLSEDEIFAKLEVSRLHAYEAKTKDANCMVAEMRAKYGL